MKWLSRKNKFYSRITGENITNKDVVIVHICFVAILYLCTIVEIINKM